MWTSDVSAWKGSSGLVESAEAVKTGTTREQLYEFRAIT